MTEKKVLVAYVTVAGSTGGVAEIIGKTLAKNSLDVDVLPVDQVEQVDGYDAVVLGSAIQGGKWLPEADNFLKKNLIILNHIPTAFFLVGLMVNNKSEDVQKLVDQFLAPQRELLSPILEGHFVGALLTKNYPFWTGFGMRFFIAYCGLGFRGGDFRNPEAIQAWAEKLVPLLNFYTYYS